jgi:cytochrome P450
VLSHIRWTDSLLLTPLRSVGGSDTTPSAMAFFVLAMIVYPEVQVRAQAELDAVVGRTRLPTFADFQHLPYIRATVKELLRWRPNAPLGTPHSTSEDDWYDGMFIPKGTICIPNVWNMNRDPEIYGDNTEHFDPARFLDERGEIAPRLLELKKDGHFTYGFGSRICAGRHLADNALFINIATLLWGMNFKRKKDASGNLIPLDLEGWVDGGLVMLVDFCPRSAMWMLTVSVSADIRSRTSSRPFRAFRRFLPCLHRNASCGYEHEVA